MIEEHGSRFWFYLLMALAVHAAVLVVMSWQKEIHRKEELFVVDLQPSEPVERGKPVPLKIEERRFEVPKETFTPPPVERVSEIPLPEVSESHSAPPREAVRIAPKRIRFPMRVTKASPAPRGGAAGERDERARYFSAVRARIVANKRYPRLSVRRGEEGSVKVRFRLNRNGELKDGPRIVVSSGHPMLDREALRSVRVSAPFPPFPPVIRQASLDLSVVIEFTLRDEP